MIKLGLSLLTYVVVVELDSLLNCICFVLWIVYLRFKNTFFPFVRSIIELNFPPLLVISSGREAEECAAGSPESKGVERHRKLSSGCSRGRW